MAHDLIFANARVKARENNLLTRDKLLRMAESDLADAFSMISEVQYDVESGDVDVICAKEEGKLVEFLKELDTDKAFINCLISEYDYKALKRAFKMKMERQNFDFSPFAVQGFIPLDKLKSAVFGDDYEVFSDTVKKVLIALDEKSVTSSVRPSEVESRIDKAMYVDFLSKLTAKPGYEYYSKRVFSTNLITLLRVNKLGLDVDFFESQYVGDNESDYELMSSLVGQTNETILEAYRVSEHKEVVESILADDLESGEAYADNMLIRALSTYKADMFSELLLAGYFVAKRAEIGNVRLILTCIKNKVDAGEVIKRLRTCYYE